MLIPPWAVAALSSPTNLSVCSVHSTLLSNNEISLCKYQFQLTLKSIKLSTFHPGSDYKSTYTSEHTASNQFPINVHIHRSCKKLGSRFFITNCMEENRIKVIIYMELMSSFTSLQIHVNYYWKFQHQSLHRSISFPWSCYLIFHKHQFNSADLLPFFIFRSCQLKIVGTIFLLTANSFAY